MVDILKVKKGYKANLPTLQPGEPGFCLDTEEFYLGGESGNVLVGGNKSIEKEFNTIGKTIYVDCINGSDDAGTGESETPYQTVQKVIDTLPAVTVNGNILIDLAPGTYTEQISINGKYTLTPYRLILQGKVDENNIPTVIFDGGNGIRAYGLMFSDYMMVKLQDVKFQNFSDYNDCGVIVQNFCNLWTKNVHGYNCGWAPISVNMSSRLYMEGGIIDSCRQGVKIYGNCMFTVGYKTGTTFTNCTEAGVLVQNQCNGHVDYSTLDGNQVGVYLINQSRAHVMQSTLSNHTEVGVKATMASTWYDDANTYSNNTKNHATFTYSSEFARDDEKYSKLYAIENYLDATNYSHTGVLAETEIVTGYSLPSDTIIEPGQKLIIQATGTFEGTGMKSIFIRIAGSLICGFQSITDSGNGWKLKAEIYPTTYNAQKVISSYFDGGSKQGVEYFDRSFYLNSDRAITLNGALTDTTGTINIKTFEVIQEV